MKNRNQSRAALAWGFVTLFAILVLGLGLSARPAAAAPFAYVVIETITFCCGGVITSDAVSVIDTATNEVVGTPIGVVPGAFSVAVTPDGKHVYVASFGDPFNGDPGGVSVIDTATNNALRVTVDGAFAVAITPDGKHAYVTTVFNTVSVIATATNTVVATVPVVGVA